MISDNELKAEFDKMILSASGWRKIFAKTGKSEDKIKSVKYADLLLITHAATAFASFLKTEFKHINTIVIGRDARPTGRLLEETFIKALSRTNYNLKAIGCSAAPEIMAYSKNIKAAFIYISASHNPIGYNGIKFGLNLGGVLNAEQSKILIKDFTENCMQNGSANKADKILADMDKEKTAMVLKHIPLLKKEALAAYYNFSKEVISASYDKTAQKDFFDLCKITCEKAKNENTPFCIIADFNGSARASSIDRIFFEDCGINLIGIAEKEGDIRHAILPEGENLNFCAAEMEKYEKINKNSFEKKCFLGYMPDCDGDRGNIIYWSTKRNKALVLEAQEVFALSVIAELSYLFYCKENNNPLAIAVNGPTSLRIEEIAECFNAEVFRAEVGEANVVNLASELRNKNYIVRILGEGSNGGNITYPSSVRDPINTIFAILKFFLLKSEKDKKGLFEIWCGKAGTPEKYKEDFSLEDIIETIPLYTTTPTGESRAVLKITTQDHAVLKRRYQKIFEQEWEEKKEELRSKFGIISFKPICNNGTIQQTNIPDFGISQKGGLKIQFYGKDEKPVGFIWMRGSGTEPVFRIMADIKGVSEEAEKYLINWQSKMVQKADETNIN